MKKKLACLDRTLKTKVPLLTFLQLKHDTFRRFLFTLLRIKLGAEVNEVVSSKSDKILLRTRTISLVPFQSWRETFQIQRKMKKKGRFRGHPEGYCLLSSSLSPMNGFLTSKSWWEQISKSKIELSR